MGLRQSVIRLVVPGLMVFAGYWAQAQEAVPGELIVKMKGKPSGSKSANFTNRFSGKLALKATFGKLGMHYMAVKQGQTVQQAIDELRQDPDVEYAEPNYILKKVEDAPQDETRKFTTQEMQDVVMQNFAQGTYSQSSADTKVTQAWSQMSPSSTDTPIVAIVDTGVDYTHSVFVNSGAIWANPGETGLDANGHDRATNGIDDDGNGYVDDVRGWNFHDHNKNPYDDDDHGTHVAGIILGVTQDIFAGTLQPAKIRLMPLKFLGADGSGSTSDAIQAIYYAVNNGAQVINNSWGGGNYSQSLHDAMAYAYAQGVVLVAAAGNNGTNNDVKAMYPANYPVPSLISVAATNDWDALASFSNYGLNTVHMAAPGVSIRSTVPGNYFQYMSGTSMAAPFVSGVAALVLREAPQLTGYQVKNLIVNSSTSINGLIPKTQSGSRANSLTSVVNAKMETGSQATQPVYVASAPSGYRDPASEATAKGGCGLVSTSVMSRSFNGKGPSDPNSSSPIGLIVALTLLPLVVWQVVKSKALQAASGKNRRQFERFVMNSEIKVRIGDREMVGQMNTISLGGASFKADAMLEKGGVVTLQIASPDGGEQVSVEGRIVWNEQNQAYGVQFAGAKDSVLDSISKWSRNLVKAS